MKCLYGFFIVLFLLVNSNAQDLPNKIRGYKVHKAKISVKTHDQKQDNPDNKEKVAFVKVGEPEFISVGLIGVSFELNAELNSLDQSGEVDFLTFKDIRVNGIAVDVEEYKDSFEFSKNELVQLPKPFKLNVSIPQSLFGAAKEVWESKEKWRVTGRVFVFGRFKKSIFKFKRVVPVDIDIEIDNPLTLIDD